MATKLERLRWKLFLKKRELLMHYGFMFGLIHPYEEETLEKLKEIYYGPIPASMIIKAVNMANHHCYDRALLLCFAFTDDKYEMVDADIDEITLHPAIVDEYRNSNDEHYGNHCFIIREKQDGSRWIYDTTDGLVYDEKLYFKIQSPKITKVNSKEEVINFIEYQDILENNRMGRIEEDKYLLPTMLPLYEMNVENYEDGIYTESLKQEIKEFKEKIGYDQICFEVNQRKLSYAKEKSKTDDKKKTSINAC